MARRNILGRIFDRILGRKPTVGPPSSIDLPPARPRPIIRPPTESTLRQRAINNILSKHALANRKTVAAGVASMDIREVRWTITATRDQLVARARADADRLIRLIDGRQIPYNPWWYN